MQQKEVKLWLAPMEGVVDVVMRNFLTSFGGIDHCVTEFIRVTNKLLPDAIFFRYCPELKSNCKTASQVPVSLQLLGGDPIALSENAVRLVELGAQHIDLNFGCPAKTVNRHDGGAILLKSPERLFKITSAVRSSLEKNIPVTAKMRLGYDTEELCVENAQALADAGATHLTIHCRTKVQMYSPPAHWEWIAKIKSQIKIPIVANGDIFTTEDFHRCKDITGCDQFMLGRGALRDPFLFMKIKLAQQDQNIQTQHALKFFRMNKTVSPYFAQARTKQWISIVAKQNNFFQYIFTELKAITNPAHFEERLISLCPQK